MVVQPDRRARTLHRRERAQFGGRVQWEAVFFGLLAAVGLAALLVAMVLGALVAAGVTDFSEKASTFADHLTTGGGAIAVAVLALSYLTGGYVAARMARFDGWRQGVGIWILSVLMMLAILIAAWVSGGQLDPAKSISLPGDPVDEGPLSHTVVLLAALVVIPLASAILGGVLGERFHRAVDRAGFTEPEPAVWPSDAETTEPEGEQEPESTETEAPV